MKKFFVASALAAMVSVGMVASNAMAIGFSFTGDYTMTNADGDPFLEYLNLGTAMISQANFIPALDGIFYDGGDTSKIEKVVFGQFEINNTPVQIDDDVYYYTFDSPVPNGFQVFDHDGTTLLFSAGIELGKLKIDGHTASINSQLSMNLVNITIGSYTIGTSAIVDSFLTNPMGPGGGTTITLQFENNLFDAINNAAPYTVESFGSTYSGFARPIPEPGVTMLFGLGVVGFAGVIRRRKTFSA